MAKGEDVKLRVQSVYDLMYGPGGDMLLMWMYWMLENRPPEAAISHRRMPTYEEHKAFVRSRPYKAWMVFADIELAPETWIAQAYITDRDEVGIFVNPYYQGRGVGSKILWALKETQPRLLANIAPGNKRSHEFFRKHGFGVIQTTYEWEKQHENRS